MHRTRNSIGKVIGVAALGVAFAALGTGAAQAVPAVPGVGTVLGAVPVAQGALQNSPVSPAREDGTRVTRSDRSQSGPSAVIAGIPVAEHGVPLGLGG